ncbi:MAG: class I SAM-dependent methyltransferase [Planctomycetaceae bacterium]|nr:class I SAM-dependent methyltransferase [Planctomycetaceae bacterium]
MAGFIDQSLRRALYAGFQFGPAVKRWVKSKPRLASIAFDLWSSGYFNHAEIHEKMLADRMRIESYFQAVSRHVRPDDVVVDLGTGTGILAFLAAQRGAAKVYAVEHSAMIETAQHLAEANGLRNVEFRRCNSKDFHCEEKPTSSFTSRLAVRSSMRT